MSPKQHALLFEHIKEQFRLSLGGIHGVSHWLRVRHLGLELAGHTGANPEVVSCFALLHDSQRHDEHFDHHHGRRAANFAVSLCGTLLHLDAHAVEQLRIACLGHSRGRRHKDPTVRTCWDADRLDLWRLGIEPDPALLLNDAARQPDMIAQARALALRK